MRVGAKNFGRHRRRCARYSFRNSVNFSNFAFYFSSIFKNDKKMTKAENEYGENAVDNMMVDYDYHVNTGELPELFDELSVDNFIANLNDWD